MKRKHLLFAILVLTALLFLLPGGEAGAAVLSRKKVTLRVGETGSVRILKPGKRAWTCSAVKGKDLIEIAPSASGLRVRIRALKEGKAKIGVTNGKKTLTCLVTVQASADEEEKMRREEAKETDGRAFTLTAGGLSFRVTAADTEAAEKLMELLPLTADFSELNGNEKYFYSEVSFPADSRRAGTIHAGDLKLYGDDCLVVFYETFASGYSYTDLGIVEDPEGLKEALGKGSVTVTLSE